MRGLLLGMLGIGLTALPSPVAGQPAKAGKMPWLTSYEEAHAVARQTGKPLLVVFR